MTQTLGVGVHGYGPDLVGQMRAVGPKFSHRCRLCEALPLQSDMHLSPALSELPDLDRNG